MANSGVAAGSHRLTCLAARTPADPRRARSRSRTRDAECARPAAARQPGRAADAPRLGHRGMSGGCRDPRRRGDAAAVCGGYLFPSRSVASSAERNRPPGHAGSPASRQPRPALAALTATPAQPDGNVETTYSDAAAGAEPPIEPPRSAASDTHYAPGASGRRLATGVFALAHRAGAGGRRRAVDRARLPADPAARRRRAAAGRAARRLAAAGSARAAAAADRSAAGAAMARPAAARQTSVRTAMAERDAAAAMRAARHDPIAPRAGPNGGFLALVAGLAVALGRPLLARSWAIRRSTA